MSTDIEEERRTNKKKADRYQIRREDEEWEHDYLDKRFAVECWDFSRDGRHYLIGQVKNLTLRNLLLATRPQYLLTHPEKKTR